jgi:hypothetical protein
MAIYLDHAATTPIRPEVLEAMLPYLTEHQGNPSSIHASGRRARQALDEAREEIARHLGAKPREIVFTASGTEADNLAVRGVAWAASAKGRHVVTSAVEHKAILATTAVLERQGFEVTVVGVDRYGRVDPDEVAAGHHRSHDARERPVRQQRGRHAAAGGRHRRHLPRARGGVPRRRGPVRRVRASGPGRLAGDARQPVGPQALRPEGRRRPLRPPGHRDAAADRAAERRSASVAPGRRTCPPSPASPPPCASRTPIRPTSCRCATG